MDQKEVNDVLGLLRKSESLGENVLRNRDEIVQMDRIRQKNREALNELKKVATTESGVYLCVGNMFIKHSIKQATDLIQKDQKDVNNNIEELRQKIKRNVQNLYEIQNQGEDVNIYNLNPLSSQEMKSFSKVIDSIKKLEV